MQTEILHLLKTSSNELTSREIANRLKVTIQMAARACNQLFKYGMIRKRRVPAKHKAPAHHKWSL